jgi:hypothetical protein
MRPALLLLAVLLTACPERRSAPEAAPPAARPGSGPPSGGVEAVSSWTSAEEACLTRWLAAEKLDAYGNPEGTMYAGGTPLFDEASGRHISRQSYLAAHRPEALRACRPGD